MSLTSGIKLHIHLLNVVVRLIVFLTSANLIFRGTDISKCFSESLGIRDNESRLLYFRSFYFDQITRKITKFFTMVAAQLFYVESLFQCACPLARHQFLFLNEVSSWPIAYVRKQKNRLFA